MAGFFLTGRAKADLKDIGRYTQRTWGAEQRDRYLGQLDACFRRIAANPSVGLSAEALRPGYRRVREGSHVIFYRRVGEDLEIVRVLHQSMLPEKHLK